MRVTTSLQNRTGKQNPNKPHQRQFSQGNHLGALNTEEQLYWGYSALQRYSLSAVHTHISVQSLLYCWETVHQAEEKFVN